MRGGLLYSFSENFKFINSIFQKQRGKLLLRNFPLNFWDFFYSPFAVTYFQELRTVTITIPGSYIISFS